MFLLFLFLQSIKNAGAYVSIFQSSAGDSQAGVAGLVQVSLSHDFVTFANARFN
jgi:hypothetical protein